MRWQPRLLITLIMATFPLCPAYFTGLEDSLFFHHQTSEAFETTHVSRDSRVSNQNFQVLQRNVFTCVSAIAWCRPTVWILRFDIFGGLFVESTFQMNTLRERIRCTSLSNGCKIPGSPRFQCLSNSVLDLAFHTSLPNCQGSKIKLHGTWYAYINGDSAVEL